MFADDQILSVYGHKFLKVRGGALVIPTLFIILPKSRKKEPAISDGN